MDLERYPPKILQQDKTGIAMLCVEEAQSRYLGGEEDPAGIWTLIVHS